MKVKFFSVFLLILGTSLMMTSYYIEHNLAEGMIVKSFQTTTSDGILIRSDIYIPKNIRRDSLIVFIHGFSGNRRYWKTMIVAFVHEGFICLSLDLRGHGGSLGAMIDNISMSYHEFEKDVIAAIKWVKDNVFLPKKIVLIGHSMGGGLVIYLGYKWSNVSIVIAIAPALFGNYLNKTSPKNLLLMAGGKDNIVGSDYVKDLFNKSAGVYPNETYYVIEKGSIVRGFYLNLNADHSSIVVDENSIKETLSWVKKYLYSEDVKSFKYIGEEESFAHLMARFSAVILVISIIPLLLPSFFSFNRFQSRNLSYKELAKYVMRAFIYPGFFAIFLYAVIASFLVLIPPFPIANLALSALIANSLLMPLIFRKKVKDTFKQALREIREIKYKEIASAIIIYLAFILPFHIIAFGFYPVSLISSEIRIAFIIIYTLILLPFFMMDEILFRGYVRDRLGDRVPNVLGSIITYSSVKGFSLAVIGTIGIFVYYGVLSKIISGATLPLTYAWICLILPDIIYHFSKNYRITAITNSLIVAMMLSQLSAAIILSRSGFLSILL